MEDITLSESEKKKIHQELSFSRGEMNAESTIIIEHDSSEDFDNYVDSKILNDDVNDDESENILADTIVPGTTVLNTDDTNSVILVVTLRKNWRKSKRK